MTESHADYVFKVIIIGDSGVGKTCFFTQFTEGGFKEDHNVTIGVEYGSKTVELNHNLIKLELWDTAGQEAFRAITRSFYRNANGVMLLYDITRIESFEHTEDWVREVRMNAAPDISIILVGNMLDLEEEREVEKEKAREFAEKIKAEGFIEASAKTDEHVRDAFDKIAEILVRKHPKKIEKMNIAPPIVVKNTQPTSKKKKGCC